MTPPLHDFGIAERLLYAGRFTPSTEDILCAIHNRRKNFKIVLKHRGMKVGYTNSFRIKG